MCIRDSAISAGSGALGGAVMFTTKDPADYLKLTGNDLSLIHI